jgi:hypothetical protein
MHLKCKSWIENMKYGREKKSILWHVMWDFVFHSFSQSCLTKIPKKWVS